ncbi:MAG: shikimate kinase, partial [Planctomycetaceae bacterium]|nr:shikimate kinase [Planctomycetaceae bacterium]
MVLTLIGYRGCGKSSVAPLLAAALNWQWIDSDHVIEETAGCSIREIFEREGEGGFRDREQQVISDLCAGDRLILAAGGGAILRDINRKIMKASGPVIWLEAAPAVLAERIAGDQATAARRPSLTGRSVTEEVAEVLAVREPIYREAATVIVQADQGTPADTVRQ